MLLQVSRYYAFGSANVRRSTAPTLSLAVHMENSTQHANKEAKQDTTHHVGSAALGTAARGLQVPMCPADPAQLWHGPWGYALSDPYLWLRCEGPASQQVQTNLEQENKYAENVLSKLSPLRDALYNEMADTVPLHEQSATWWGPATTGCSYTYQRRRGPQDSHWTTVRWQDQGAPLGSQSLQQQHNEQHSEQQHVCSTQHDGSSSHAKVLLHGIEVVLDESKLAESHSYLHVAAQQVSPDGSLLAFLIDTHGNERHSLWIKQLYSPHHVRSATSTPSCEAAVHEGSSNQLASAGLACEEGDVRSPAAEMGCMWQLAGAVCGPHLAWTQDSRGVVVTHVTPDTNETSEVVVYAVHQQHQTAHALMKDSSSVTHHGQASASAEPTPASLHWMGELSDGHWLAVAAHWCGACEIRLVSLAAFQHVTHMQHITQCLDVSQQADNSRVGMLGQQQQQDKEQLFGHQDQCASSSGSSGAEYVVALPWQDDWDVHKVEAYGNTLLLLVDSDDSPDGKVIAVPCAALTLPSDTCSMQRVGGNEQQGQVQTPIQSCVVVSGSSDYELRQMAVVGQYMAVSRTQRLVTHIDFYKLPTETSQLATFEQLKKCWSWCPLNCYAAIGICSVKTPTAMSRSCESSKHAGSSAHLETGRPVQQEPTRLRVKYSCMTQPEVTVEIDPDTCDVHTIHVEEVAGLAGQQQQQQQQCSLYVSQLVWLPAKHHSQSDAETVQIPISLAYRQDMCKRDGSSTCIMHVYGAYGSRQEPSFNPMDLALLNRGVVLAIAHVRGGGELGCAWHKMGRRRLKPNTFMDVLAAARAVCELGFTCRHKLVLWGRSAGGLAAAAAIALHPQVCQAAVLDVPFLDVLTPMCDASLPLTRKERSEWGDPLRSKEECDVILSYSPYHTLQAAVAAAHTSAMQDRSITQRPVSSCMAAASGEAGGNETTMNAVDTAAASAATGATLSAGQARALDANAAAVHWPHMLITCSMHDERVPYWLPARYVARLREALRDGTLPGTTPHDSHVQQSVVCLMTDQAAGHFGSGAAQSRLAARADKCAFMLAAAG